ncbi:hypothetical protein LDL36_13895 [Komagataeibacter sp. FNDCR1]|nr:hypothetical protein [Komagataeibacter sp. FNDCR1]
MNEISDIRATQNPELAHAISAWLNRLSCLVRRNGDDGTDEQIALYAEMLIRSFPKPAFSTDAMHYVADNCEWWPPFATMRKLLSEHWEAAKLRRMDGRARQIAGPTHGDRQELTGMDREWRRYYDRRSMTNWIEDGESGVDPRDAQNRKARTLQLIREQSPLAFEDITGRKARPDVDNAAWADPAVVRRSAREVQGSPMAASFAGMLSAAVTRFAPQNLPIVEEFFPKSGASEVRK